MVGSREDKDFAYCGSHLVQNEACDEITADLNHYVRDLQEAKLDPDRKKDPEAAVTKPEEKLFRFLLGGLTWDSMQGNPLIGEQVNRLARSVSDLRVKHLIKANKVLRGVKAIPVVIKYKTQKTSRILIYCDANLQAGRTSEEEIDSQIGIVTCLASDPEQTGSCSGSIISWASRAHLVAEWCRKCSIPLTVAHIREEGGSQMESW